MILLVFLASICSGCCLTRHQDANRAEIFFVDWNTKTSIRWSAQDVRNSSVLSSIIKGGINLKIIDQALSKLPCEAQEGDIGIDPRAVIDIYRNNKLMESYIMNQDYLFIEKENLRCKFSKNAAIELALPLLGWREFPSR